MSLKCQGLRAWGMARVLGETGKETQRQFGEPGAIHCFLAAERGWATEHIFNILSAASYWAELPG